MKLIITYFDNVKFIHTGDIKTLCDHITLQCKNNPEAIKNIRIVPDAKNKT